MDRTEPTSTMGDPNSLPVSQRVVREVAAVTDTDPADLEPLYRQVDPDCLDAIFRDSHSAFPRNAGLVTFPMADCQVVVRADGTVDVEPDAEMAGSPAPGNHDETSTRAPESPD